MKRKRFTALFTPLLVLAIALSGCGGSAAPSVDENSASANKPHENVTLSVFIYADKMNDDEFNKLIAEPVKQKYPYITMTAVRAQKGDGSLPEAIDRIVAAGDFPDMMLTYDLRIQDFKEKKLATDLTPWIKSQKYDLSKLDSGMLDTVRAYSTNGELPALPWTVNFSALFYNKDIFNKFGVAPPKDGISWEETVELAKKVTRTVEGKQYKGLDPGLFRHVISQRSIAAYDPVTHKAKLQTDEVKKVASLYEQISRIPGNDPGKDPYGIKVGRFFDSQDWAMKPMRSSDILGKLAQMQQSGIPLNWDMTSYPVFKDRPGIGMKNDITVLMISAVSKHQGEAFQVASYLTGEESQRIAAENGRISVLKEKKLRDVYGKALPFFKGKNVQAAFLVRQPKMVPPSPYDDIVYNKEGLAISKSIQVGSEDLNTILRKTEEEANQMIAEQLGN